MQEEHPPQEPSAWERIRQHKVAQWTLAYAAAAFALLQGLDIVANTFDWPRWTMRGVTVLMVVGAPVVALLAWYHGHQRRRRATRSELAKERTIIWSTDSWFLSGIECPPLTAPCHP